MPNNLFSIKL